MAVTNSLNTLLFSKALAAGAALNITTSDTDKVQLSVHWKRWSWSSRWAWRLANYRTRGKSGDNLHLSPSPEPPAPTLKTFQDPWKSMSWRCGQAYVTHCAPRALRFLAADKWTKARVSDAEELLHLGLRNQRVKALDAGECR